jgi:hypothetical protein
MRWLALLGMTFALVAAGCGGGDEEVVTSFGDFPTGDYCGTLITARVFISGAFLGANKVSQEALDELVAQCSKGDQSRRESADADTHHLHREGRR